MIALLVLLVMSLGTLAGMHMTYHRMYKNQYLEQAKSVARILLEEAVNTPYADLGSTTLLPTTGSTNRFFGNSAKAFSWTRTIGNLTGFGAGATGQLCSVTVTWTMADGNSYTYNSSTILGDL